MKLPINIYPSITSYIHHSYVNAIIESNDLLGLYVKDIEKHAWFSDSVDINYRIEDNCLYLTSDSKRKDTDFYLWRKLDNNEELVVRIDYIKRIDHLVYIEIFLSENIFDKNSRLFSIKWNKYDININEKLYNYDTKKYIYYKIIKANMNVNAYISDDGEEWIFLSEGLISNDIINKDAVLSLHIYIGNEQYQAWKYMNFLHLIYRNSDFNSINLDYFIFPRKGFDASYNNYCHFIDTVYEDYREYATIFSSIHDYIRWNINNSYYVNICLDEFYLGEIDCHNNHFSLIYGYDDEGSSYNIIKTNRSGKTISTSIGYEVLDNKDAVIGNDIVKYRFNTNAALFEFNTELFILQIKEFITGRDPSIKNANILTHQKEVYGLQIFNELMHTIKGRDRLINDRRVSFVLYEHCSIMKDRLHYLFENGFLKGSNVDELKKLCKEMLNTSVILKNLVIKNRASRNIEANIMEKIKMLFNQEITFYNALLIELQR